MQKISSLLVILDRQHADHPALQRANDLARSTGANVHVITSVHQAACDNNVMQDMSLANNLKEALLEDTGNWLQNTVENFDDEQSNITYETYWQPHLANAAVEALSQKNYDLVLKSIQPHNHFFDRLFTPSDWNLLRHCTAPLLLVHHKESWKNNRILAAIDASSSDPKHRLLNENVLQMAEQFSGYINAETHIVNASPILDMSFSMFPESPSLEDLQEDILQQHKDAAQQYAKKYNINEENIHVCEGEPNSVIIEQARKYQTDLVIIGTVAREGISGALLGNTAESVADQLPCDVLAVKILDGVGDQDEKFDT
jgi:universal stress protein E